MDRLLQVLADIAALVDLGLQIADKILARRGSDEPDNGPE